MQTARACLLSSLQTFYADNPAHLRALTDILGPRPQVSLRIIDWLVTNHCKWKNVVYSVHDPTTGCDKPFIMYIEYKNALRSYSKRMLDPFCRRERIPFIDADGQVMQTTIGQLNFFKFALTNGVVDYAIKHADEIETDMFGAIQHRAVSPGGASDSTASPRMLSPILSPVRTSAAPPKKRKELSQSAIKSCTRTRIKVVMRFK